MAGSSDERSVASRMRARGLGLLSAALLAAILPGCGGSESPSTPSGSPSPSAAPAGTARFTVDSSASRHPISPCVYGTNQPDWTSRSRA